MSFSEDESQKKGFSPQIHEVDPEDAKTEHEKKAEREKRQKRRDLEHNSLPRGEVFILVFTCIIVGVVSLSIWGVYSLYKDQRTVNISPKGEDTSAGAFECSVSKQSQLESLKPEIKKADLNEEKAKLTKLNKELETLKQKIEESRTGQTSQKQREAYNELVREYNPKRERYKQKQTELQNLQEQFNKDVEAYNAFLQNECSSVSENTSGYQIKRILGYT